MQRRKATSYRGNNRVVSKPFYWCPTTGQSYTSRDEATPDLRGELVRWDSVLEFRCYTHLLTLFASSYEVHRQVPVMVIPANDYFKEWIWKVDFALYCPITKQIKAYVECKGDYLLTDKLLCEKFNKLLNILSHTNHLVYDSLIVVGNDKSYVVPGTTKQVIKLKDLKHVVIH